MSKRYGDVGSQVYAQPPMSSDESKSRKRARSLRKPTVVREVAVQRSYEKKWLLR